MAKLTRHFFVKKCLKNKNVKYMKYELGVIGVNNAKMNIDLFALVREMYLSGRAYIWEGTM